MELQGKISSIYLSSILQLLCNDKKTGVLRVWRDEQEVKIYLHEGTIIYAVSSDKKQRLGYLLRQQGIVGEADLRTCLNLSREKKQTLGKTLVERELISTEKLEEFMHTKVEHTLYSLFLWKKGFFEYSDVKLNLSGHVITSLNTMGIILEASRRADEKAVLQKAMSPNTEVYEREVAKEHEQTIIIYPRD